MAITHPLFDKINNILKGAGFLLSSIHQPDYIAHRKQDNPNYEPAPYDRIALGTQYTDLSEDGSSLDGSYLQQWWASFGTRDSYGIFDLKITRFNGPSFNGVSYELIRVELKLVEGEDALDNDEFNNFGWQRLLLWFELPAQQLDCCVLPRLEQFLLDCDTSVYFPAK